MAYRLYLAIAVQCPKLVINIVERFLLTTWRYVAMVYPPEHDTDV